MNLGVDPRHADQMVRGVCHLPLTAPASTVRVAVFAKGDKAEEAKTAGADVVGAEDLVEKVQKGEIDFDRCIATPDMMPLVGRLGKILGPRGLMPNPKVGTVTNGRAEAAVKSPRAVRWSSASRRPASSMPASARRASPRTQAGARTSRRSPTRCSRAKPSGAKGTYVKRVAVSSTMGPGVRVEPSSVIASSAAE